MLRESDFQKRVRIIFVVGFFIVRDEWLLAFLKLRRGTFSAVCFCLVEVRFFPFVLSFSWPWLKRVPPWTRVTALAPWFVLFWRRTSLSFRFSHSWPRLNCVRLERDCNTIAFPRRGSVISLARDFLSWHIPLWRRDMFINLWKAKTGTRFLRESLSFKWINRVCRFDGFPWNLVRTFTDRCGTKPCRRIPLF